MSSQPPPEPYGQPYGQGNQPSGEQYPSQGQPPGYPPQPPGQPQYGQPAGGTTNTLAVVSLVLSLAGLVTWLSAPVGAILGHVARKQIRERGEQGEGLALTGIIVGWAITGLGLLACCGIIALAIAAESA
jgi:hypothetical protein